MRSTDASLLVWPILLYWVFRDLSPDVLCSGLPVISACVETTVSGHAPHCHCPEIRQGIWEGEMLVVCFLPHSRLSSFSRC